MTGLFIGIYSIYLITVGVQGNAGALLSEVKTDGRGYIPWLFAIIAIALLAQNETTAKIVKPFVTLLVLNFILLNFKQIEAQVKSIYNM